MRRIPLPADAARSDALVAEAVAAIRDGKIVVLPTETVYGLVADPRDPAAVARITEWKGRPHDLVFTHHIADRDAILALVPALPARIERLVDRYWPGPLTVVLPGLQGGNVGLRLPAQDFTRAVIRAYGSSLYLSSVNESGQPPIIEPDAIAAAFAGRLDLLFDDGVPALRQASTVVRYLPPPAAPEFGELEVLRTGTLSADDVLHTAARSAIFVCTGNTCRSPLSAALARRAAARRLGTTDDRVLAHGLHLYSAGIAANEGEPASDGSLLAAADIGIDLTGHRSQLLTAEMIEGAERVFCLGPAHLVAARALAPQAAERIELLDPQGGSIPDPYGTDPQTYRQTRDIIATLVDARIAELVPEL